MAKCFRIEPNKPRERERERGREREGGRIGIILSDILLYS